MMSVQIGVLFAQKAQFQPLRLLLQQFVLSMSAAAEVVRDFYR
jgi:hypothetical protein